jgi:hypothetical protein
MAKLRAAGFLGSGFLAAAAFLADIELLAGATDFAGGFLEPNVVLAAARWPEPDLPLLAHIVPESVTTR